MSKKTSLSEAILALISVKEKLEHKATAMADSIDKDDLLKSHGLNICAIGMQTAIEVLIKLNNEKPS